MTARAATKAARSALLASAEARIQRLDRAAEVRRSLEQAEAYAAYALAYLDPDLFRLARFYEASLKEKRAVLMHAKGGLGPSTLVLGDASLVGALLKLHPGSRRTLLTCEVGHVEQALRTHNLWRPQTMLRMQVKREAFRPPQSLNGVRRLGAMDAPELNRLYALEGDGTWYSGRQINAGVYYGAFNRGRLVAAAGTHILSRREGVGVVGNVFTHPDQRGRGYGTAVTAAVSAHLLHDCPLVVLNVDPVNRPARQVYEKLGYVETGRLIEALSTLRRPLSPLPLAQRLLARWRGATPGIEAVTL